MNPTASGSPLGGGFKSKESSQDYSSLNLVILPEFQPMLYMCAKFQRNRVVWSIAQTIKYNQVDLNTLVF